jgi:acyl-ACP thioesterase
MWLDDIRIDTWPSDKLKFHAARDFRIFNSREEEIGTATSSWMMIDVKKRTTVQLPDFLDKLKNTEAGRALNDPFDKLPKIKNPEIEKMFYVRLNDLDMNQHVNSVHYLSWGLETVPVEFRKEHLLTDVEINYRAECYYGDKIISRNEKTMDDGRTVFIHQLFKGKDGREITRMRSSWQKK